MNCQNCGAQLMGVEHACPVCGTPLPQPVPQSSMYQQPMPAPAAPNIVVEETTQEVSERPQKDNKIFAIIILIVAVAAIAVGIFLAITAKESKMEKQEKPTQNTVTHAGYTFTFPLTYPATVKDDLGLTVTDSKYNIFTINVDYTNSYADYKKYITDKYSKEATNMIKKAGDREYIEITITDENKNYALEYVTVGKDELSCFVGMVVKPDFSKIMDDELYVLNDFLDNAEKTTEVEKGSTEDYGKSGIKIQTLDIEKFKS